MAAAVGLMSPFASLIWIGVGLICVHIVASIVTSREQLGDTERPPSGRKKRHLALKWATGALLGAAAAVHIILPKSSELATVCIVALCVVLAVHLCVGSKSLLRDLGLSARLKIAFRIIVCAIAAAAAIAVIVGGMHA